MGVLKRDDADLECFSDTSLASLRCFADNNVLAVLLVSSLL